MEVLVPAAGLSTRFPGPAPKYLWRDHAGNSMLYRAIQPFLGKHNILVGILAAHQDLFNVTSFIANEFGQEVQTVIIPEVTSGPAETVYQMIVRSNVNLESELLVKDCDSFFVHTESPGAYVCVDTAIGIPQSNKSFVVVDQDQTIKQIVEKKVISNLYCVGGYKFNKVKDFARGYEECKNTTSSEFFVSGVIQYLINEGNVFTTKSVSKYIDVGTMQDWMEYNK